MGRTLARGIVLYTCTVTEPFLPSEQQPSSKRIICNDAYPWTRLTYKGGSGFLHQMAASRGLRQLGKRMRSGNLH
jgi:hypothetical protein